jgi:hypothetical protein
MNQPNVADLNEGQFAVPHEIVNLGSAQPGDRCHFIDAVGEPSMGLQWNRHVCTPGV